jgi:putative transposase
MACFIYLVLQCLNRARLRETPVDLICIGRIGPIGMLVFRQTGPVLRAQGVVVKRSRFSVEQIVAVLKQAELGMPVADVIRKIGISEQTFYRWKKQYASLEPDQARELKQLQEENSRLKKLVADLSLDKAILQDIASKKWGGPR